MAGALWIDEETAGSGIMARIAAELELPRCGGNIRPEAGDAVLIFRRPLRERTAAERGYAPGVWLMDGRPGLVPDDIEQMRLAGVRFDPAVAGEAVAACGSDRQAGDAGGVRLFEVPVFHLQPLAVRRVGPGSGLLPADWEGPHPLRRRLEAAAVKALYAAGRDFGTVRLAASDDGAVRIAGPFGEPSERDLPLWAEAIRTFRAALAEEAETGRRPELLIGADPEFLLVGTDGRIVSASRYFPRDGAAGSDALRVRGRLRCPVAELRPDPAPDPAGLMRGIRGLMRRAEAMTAAADRPLRWLAGGMPVPGFALGGHLHLNVPPSARLLRVLDSCVALPLAAAEDARALRRRPRYGALGDFRAKHYGFEYRTPPSWLVSPLAAQAAFAAALLAARHTAELAALTGLPSEAESGRRAYYEGDRDALRAIARRVHDAMRRVPGYALYRRWIAPFFAALDRGAAWSEDTDIRPKWGLPVRDVSAGGTGGSGLGISATTQAGPHAADSPAVRVRFD